MKLLIVRHADPNYPIDSLTEKGWREAEYLSERLSKLDVKQFYISTMGRAKDTASLTLKKMGKTAKECEWLQEFYTTVVRPNLEDKFPCAWDWLPQDWTVYEEAYSDTEWMQVPAFRESNAPEKYKMVIKEFDKVLKEHGYQRNGRTYKAIKPSNDTIVFFCHFGIECVLLSHLLGISPAVLWHGLCALPSSVTTLVTEERRSGIASFRMNGFGDISHLYANEEAPSFSGRFRECYHNDDERLD